MDDDRFRGSVIGGVYGTMLGSAVKGAPAELIQKLYPNGLHTIARGGNLRYTRISAIGLRYRHTPLHELYAAVSGNTHHATAFILAAAVAYLSKSDVNTFNTTYFMQHLEIIAHTDELKNRLHMISSNCELIRPIHDDWEAHFQTHDWKNELTFRYIIADKYQSNSVDALACALYAFCQHWETPEDVIKASVHYGGDTESVASMAGNLAFALHGDNAIPKSWTDSLAYEKEFVTKVFSSS